MDGRMGADDLWYKDAVFYELHVKAFYDSNKDGVGDFRGLMEKLDYIQDLGVDCIWLLPFYPSPLRDDGYDIADFYNVHPSYGTLADFRAFLRAAHHRRIRVISDLVMNHTSDQHPWFQEARRSPDSRYRNYYVWSQTYQKYADARIIFTDTERSNWSWDMDAGAYYWHRFFSHQPDLNYDNPQVRRAMLKVIRSWLDMGLDGFRMDAVPYLFEREGTNCENLPETHDYLRDVRKAVDKSHPGSVLLCEANQWPQDVRPYFGDGDECHMAFNFPVMPRIFMGLRREDRLPIVDIIEQTPGIPANCQWGLFLRNHDELTLEMVTDEERDYMYREFATDPRMKLNLGIRRRLAPLMGNGRRQMELLTSLLFTLPGSPIIYYGDEIGMGDNIYLGDRNGVRTPMQWSGDRNAGFSRADTAQLYSTLITDPVYGYQAVNVEAQQRSPSSLLNWTKRMIRIRKRYPVFGRGSIEFLDPENRKVLAYLRSDGEQTVLVVANLSRFSQPVELDLQRFRGMTLVELIGETRFPAVREHPYFLSLGPHGFYWFRLEKGLDPDPPGILTPEAAPLEVGTAAPVEIGKG
jgi:maltose alpha-D-glucosyltransferase / alpha-amylase